MDGDSHRPLPKRSRRKWMSLVAGGFVFAGIAAVRLFGGGKRTPLELLRGTWLSDGDRSIDDWKNARGLNDAQVAKFRALLGKLRVTWTEETFTTDLDGIQIEKPFSVVDQNDHEIVVRMMSTIIGKDEDTRIHFESADTYWVNVMDGPLREYFNRVT